MPQTQSDTTTLLKQMFSFTKLANPSSLVLLLTHIPYAKAEELWHQFGINVQGRLFAQYFDAFNGGFGPLPPRENFNPIVQAMLQNCTGDLFDYENGLYSSLAWQPPAVFCHFSDFPYIRAYLSCLDAWCGPPFYDLIREQYARCTGQFIAEYCNANHSLFSVNSTSNQTFVGEQSEGFPLLKEWLFIGSISASASMMLGLIAFSAYKKFQNKPKLKEEPKEKEESLVAIQSNHRSYRHKLFDFFRPAKQNEVKVVSNMGLTL